MAVIIGDDVLEMAGLEIAAELRARGVATDDAMNIAVGVTQKLRWFFGGGNVYFTKDHHRKLSQRDTDIFDAFDGGNFAELAFKYGLSEMRIRQIIGKIRPGDFQQGQCRPRKSDC